MPMVILRSPSGTMMPPSISVSYNMARRPLQSERAAVVLPALRGSGLSSGGRWGAPATRSNSASYFFLAGAAIGAGAATLLNISTTYCHLPLAFLRRTSAYFTVSAAPPIL